MHADRYGRFYDGKSASACNHAEVHVESEGFYISAHSTDFALVDPFRAGSLSQRARQNQLQCPQTIGSSMYIHISYSSDFFIGRGVGADFPGCLSSLAYFV